MSLQKEATIHDCVVNFQCVHTGPTRCRSVSVLLRLPEDSQIPTFLGSTQPGVIPLTTHSLCQSMSALLQLCHKCKPPPGLTATKAKRLQEAQLPCLSPIKPQGRGSLCHALLSVVCCPVVPADGSVVPMELPSLQADREGFISAVCEHLRALLGPLALQLLPKGVQLMFLTLGEPG